MRCPQCEEGTIEMIALRSGFDILTCNFCGTLWRDVEEVGRGIGHTLHALRDDEDLEYGYKEVSEKDQEHEDLYRSVLR